MWFKKKQSDPEPSMQDLLLEARARLARYELLPEGDFTRMPSNYSPFIRHGVDEKPKAIARIKARIAELEVLAGKDHA